MYSLYWAFATMTTVGYGDVSAVNDTERIVSIFLMVIGVTLFGYNLFMASAVRQRRRVLVLPARLRGRLRDVQRQRNHCDLFLEVGVH